MFWEAFVTIWFVVAPPVTELRLTNERDATLSGGTVHIHLLRIGASPGCLGGPIGCPTDARLLVTHGDAARRIILLVPRGRPDDDAERVASAFGWTFRLRSVKDGEVVLDARPGPP